ncbi:hypothetical protein Tco_0802867 [Tanacetum coccineum]|uniref:Uncharacterized protein n=1 Tax=Tanacetum coccineum TaxID=301880 RepID=A0ABQ5A002_9ASTR
MISSKEQWNHPGQQSQFPRHALENGCTLERRYSRSLSHDWNERSALETSWRKDSSSQMCVANDKEACRRRSHSTELGIVRTKLYTDPQPFQPTCSSLPTNDSGSSLEFVYPSYTCDYPGTKSTLRHQSDHALYRENSKTTPEGPMVVDFKEKKSSQSVVVTVVKRIKLSMGGERRNVGRGDSALRDAGGML